MFRAILISAALVGTTVTGGLGLSYAHSHTMAFGELAGDVDSTSEVLVAPAPDATQAPLNARRDLVAVIAPKIAAPKLPVIEADPGLDLAALDESQISDALTDVQGADDKISWSPVPIPRPGSLEFAGKRKETPRQSTEPQVARQVAATTPVAPTRVRTPQQRFAAQPTSQDLVVVVRDGRRYLGKPNAERTAVMLQSSPRYSVGVYR